MKHDLSNLVAMTVDDSQNMRLLVRTMLRSFGIQAILDARNGEEAMELVRNHETKIDVIICDWNMEGGNGHDFMKAIRQDPGAPWTRTPVIILSGHAEPSIIQAARDIGINSFLCKPVTSKHLLAHILRATGTQQNFIANATYVGPDRRSRQVAVTTENRRDATTKPPVEDRMTFVIDE